MASKKLKEKIESLVSAGFLTYLSFDESIGNKTLSSTLSKISENIATYLEALYGIPKSVLNFALTLTAVAILYLLARKALIRFLILLWLFIIVWIILVSTGVFDILEAFLP